MPNMQADQGQEENQELRAQLAASQARVGELEEVINKADYRHIMDPPDGGDPTLAEKAKYLVDRISHANTQIATLQATLAAREEQLRLANIDQANTEAALNDARQDAARLRDLLALSKCGTCDGSGWYHDTDPVTGGQVQAQCRYCFNKPTRR